MSEPGSTPLPTVTGQRPRATFAFASLVLLGTVSLMGSASAQDTVPMDFDGVELKYVLDAVADLTGKRFLYQGGAGGQGGQGIANQEVYFKCPQPIPVRRVYEIFEAMMELHGFALIETGSEDSRIVKIVNITKANIKAVDYVDAEELEKARVEDRFVTFAYNFEHISDGLRVQQQLRTIAPGTADGLLILGVQNLPFIIMSGFAPTVYRLYRILLQMDVPPEQDEIVVVPIMYAIASDIKGLVDPLLQRRPGGAQGAGTYVQEEVPVVQADERTNALIIQGTPRAIAEILGIVEKLDTQVESTTRFHLVKLKHSVAEDLATVLNEVVGNLQAGQPTRRAGAAPVAPGQGGIVGDINISYDPATNALIVVALDRDFEELGELITQLDQRKRQVYIEVAFVEVAGRANLSHAVELAAIDLANDLGTRVAAATFFSGESGPFSVLVDDQGNPLNGSGVPAGRLPLPPSNGALITVFNEDIFSVPLMLRALATQADVEVLATPRVMANDNEEAHIILRDEEPTSSINTTDTGVTSQTFAGTEDAVTELRITPHIGSDDELNLEILQIIEEFGERPIAGLPPSKISREIETRVTVPNNHTIVLGGLRSKRSTATVSKVPILGDMPILGVLFQFRETSTDQNDIYIFLTPRILSDTDFSDMKALAQEHLEELEENARTATVEGIDPTYRRGLIHADEVRPTDYFDYRRPGESTPVGGNMRPLMPLYPADMESAPAPGGTYTPPPGDSSPGR